MVLLAWQFSLLTSIFMSACTLSMLPVPDPQLRLKSLQRLRSKKKDHLHPRVKNEGIALTVLKTVLKVNSLVQSNRAPVHKKQISFAHLCLQDNRPLGNGCKHQFIQTNGSMIILLCTYGYLHQGMKMASNSHQQSIILDQCKL